MKNILDCMLRLTIYKIANASFESMDAQSVIRIMDNIVAISINYRGKRWNIQLQLRGNEFSVYCNQGSCVDLTEDKYEKFPKTVKERFEFYMESFWPNNMDTLLPQ